MPAPFSDFAGVKRHYREVFPRARARQFKFTSQKDRQGCSCPTLPRTGLDFTGAWTGEREALNEPGLKKPLNSDPAIHVNVPNATSSKLQNDLGWRPRHALHHSRESTILIPMNVFGSRVRKSQLRAVIAIVVVAAAFLLQVTLVTSAYQLVRRWLGISPPPPKTLLCSAYSLLMSFRLIWWLAIGFAVMAAAVLMMVAVGDAQLHSSLGSAPLRVAYGAAWLLAEILGAAAEEILYRGLILVLITRLCGKRTAIVTSAFAFALGHGANPGASYVWMVRLAVAGLLLAYSVFRSGTVWWGTGYHAGWNFSSAPLFGAVGSGYLDQGSIFTFLPSGSALITGGPVGPEGSAFAFLAVVIGIGFIVLTVPPNEQRHYHER